MARNLLNYHQPDPMDEEEFLREMERRRAEFGGKYPDLGVYPVQPVEAAPLVRDPWAAREEALAEQQPPGLQKDFDAEHDSSALHYAPDYESPIDQTTNQSTALQPQWFDDFNRRAMARGGIPTIAQQAPESPQPEPVRSTTVDVTVPTDRETPPAKLAGPPATHTPEPPIVDVSNPKIREVEPNAPPPPSQAKETPDPALMRAPAPEYAPPDYRHEAERIVDMGEGTGARGNFYGYEDEVNRTREQRIAAAGQAYDAVGNPYSDTHDPRELIGRRAGEVVGGPTTGRWEDEFNKAHQPLTDTQIRRRAAALSIFAGPEAANAYYNREQRVRAGYDEGIANARARDFGEQRISKGTAEAIAASGIGGSPEEIANLRNNSGQVEAWQKGGFAQGNRLDSLNERQRQFDVATIQKQSLADQDRHFKEVEGYRNRVAKLEMMQTLKAGTPLQQQAKVGSIAKWLHERTPLQKMGRQGWELAQAYAATGDVSVLPPALRTVDMEKAWIEGASYTLTPSGPSTLNPGPSIAKDVGTTVAKEPMSPSNKRVYDELFSLRYAVNEAKEAWKKLSPEARRDFVTYGLRTPEAWREYGTLQHFGPQVAALHRLKNRIIAMEAGKGQTPSEVANQLQGLGVTNADYWNGLKSPTGFDDALRSLDVFTTQRYLDGKARNRW